MYKIIKNLKVLHICTADSGGAGNAAIRLHLGLISQGIDSKFLCLNKKTIDVPEVYRHSKLPKPRLHERILKRKGFLLSEREKNLKVLKKNKGNFEIFSFPNTDYFVEEHFLVKEADIINLHWISYFINIKTFFKNVRKPIVWTLHDMNPFQGGFHYKSDSYRNRNTFRELEENLIEIKRVAMNESNISVVGLSKWLLNESKKCHIFKNRSHYLIPNGIDTQIFKPHNKEFAKEVFNIPIDSKVILFVSQSTSNYRKGFDLLIESLRHLQTKYYLLAIGRINSNEDIEDIHAVGHVSDSRMMSLLYSAADVFVIPSREDNLPNTVLEAMSCGTPVVGFSIGGIPDMVIDGETGLLADPENSIDLSNKIEKLLSEPSLRNEMSLKARKCILENYTLEIQANKYIASYKEIIM